MRLAAPAAWSRPGLGRRGRPARGPRPTSLAPRSARALARLVPAELRRHRLGDARAAPRRPPRRSRAPRAGRARVRRSSTSPSERACSWRDGERAPRRAGRAGPATIRRAQPRPRRRQLQHLAARRGRSGRRGSRRLSSSTPSTSGRSLVARRLSERDLVRAAGRLAHLPLDHPVDGHLGHPAPGRELPAGDREQPRTGLVELGPARDVDALLRVAGGDQRPHAGVGAARCRRRRSRCRRRRSPRRAGSCDVLPGRAARGRGCPRSRCRWCRSACCPSQGSANDRAPLARGHDHAGVQRQPLAVDSTWRAPARPDAGHLLLPVAARRAGSGPPTRRSR